MTIHGPICLAMPARSKQSHVKARAEMLGIATNLGSLGRSLDSFHSSGVKSELSCWANSTIAFAEGATSDIASLGTFVLSHPISTGVTRGLSFPSANCVPSNIDTKRLKDQTIHLRLTYIFFGCLPGLHCERTSLRRMPRWAVVKKRWLPPWDPANALCCGHGARIMHTIAI